MIDIFLDRYVYWAVLTLLAIGLYGMLVMGNLAKKLVGMVIFTTAIYLFFIQGSLLDGGVTPIIDPSIGSDPTRYVDPLPHLLILTAIVVGVGVLGVGLALLVRIYQTHGTFDEAVVADRLSGGTPPIGADSEKPATGAGTAERAAERRAGHDAEHGGDGSGPRVDGSA